MASLAPLAWNLCDVASDLASEQRRRRPRFLHNQPLGLHTMLALFLNHPPIFVAGEIALCLSLALFVGALIAAIVSRASEISQLREAGHPNTTIVRQSLAEPIYARPNVPRPATATTPVVRSRAAIRVAPTRHLVLRRLGPDARAV